MNMDKVFKIGVLILGVAFLVLYFFSSQNGRYSFYKPGDTYIVLDTRHGSFYYLQAKEKNGLLLIQ